MILLIDNYDSFSYNLYQLVGTLTRISGWKEMMRWQLKTFGN